MLNVNQLVGFGAGGVTKKDSVFLGYRDSVSTGPYSFSGVDLGQPDPSRIIVVAAQSYSATPNINYVRIDGVDMTEVAVQRSSSNLTEVGIWVLTLPSGSTGEITYAQAGGGNYGGIGVWALYGMESATPYVTAGDGSSPINLNSNVVADSFGIAIDRQHQNNAVTATWTGLNKQNEVYNQSVNDSTVSVANGYFTAAESPRTINVTWSIAADGHWAGVFAVWK